MYLMYFYFQLEQRCFTQQEQLECLQEQQEEDHLKYQKRISELEARVEQVREGRKGGGGGRKYKVPCHPSKERYKALMNFFAT